MKTENPFVEAMKGLNQATANLSKGTDKPVWRKHCWRGDPSLGVVRKIYVAKEK